VFLDLWLDRLPLPSGDRLGLLRELVFVQPRLVDHVLVVRVAVVFIRLGARVVLAGSL